MKEKLKKAIENSRQLDYTKEGKYTVGQWLDEWFEAYAKVKVRPSSHQTYKGYIENHIKPNIGDIPIEKLTSLTLQKFYKKLLTEGRVPRIESEKQPKGLSAKTVRNINQVISSAMDMAVKHKLILSNPTGGCELPKVEHREMHTIHAEQLGAFLREAKESGVYELYYLDLATGLRRGELLGLKWEDVDLAHGVIHVKRQVARIDGKVKEVPLKTKNSYRNISISKDAVTMLKEMEKHRVCEYVFPSPNGGPISPDSVQKGLETPRPPQPYRVWDPHSLATAVAVTQRSGGSPRKETPTPVKQLTFPQSAEAPPASASPPTLWVVRSRSRAGLWVSRRRQSCKKRKWWRGSRTTRLGRNYNSQQAAGPRTTAAEESQLAGEFCARCWDGTLIEFAGFAAASRGPHAVRRTQCAAARQSGNLGGGHLCN